MTKARRMLGVWFGMDVGQLDTDVCFDARLHKGIVLGWLDTDGALLGMEVGQLETKA